MQPFDKHKFAQQPEYYKKNSKLLAREQIIQAYRQITGNHSIPTNKGYWTLCNKQPNVKGAEIVQLVEAGLISKNQFHGIDYDIKNEGIIEFNRKEHPEANWYRGDWLEIIDEHYDLFNPEIIYFDYTKTLATTGCHVYIAKTLNLCPLNTFVAINLMLSDGHSSKRFDPNLIENIGKHLRSPNEWRLEQQYYPYKASRTEMGTFILVRK